MRSVALAFVSTLLLSPISAFSTHGDDHAVSKVIKDIKVGDVSTSKVARIAVTVDYLESDVDYVCDREKDTCLEQHKCHQKNQKDHKDHKDHKNHKNHKDEVDEDDEDDEKDEKDEKDEIDESCGRKNKCYEKKKLCHKNYNCNKKSKICHNNTTNRYGFRCGDKFYNQAKVLAAAKAACKKIANNSQSGAFPAPHTALKFKQVGPYVEWPVIRNGRFYNRWRKSKQRIIMTVDCGVVGAVVRHKDGDYTKCKYERH